MKVTERQEQILNNLIQEYIDKARPVSSEHLQKRCNLDICPATIRIEMQKLTDMGYLWQPHTSAGRIPTDKGYRFFVDKLLNSNFGKELFFDDLEKIKKEFEDDFKFVESITKKLAAGSLSLAFCYLFDRDFLWKDGWKEVFQNPEFKETKFLEDFVKAEEALEQNIKKLVKNSWGLSEIKVFIGREKSFLKSKDFSLIASESQFPDNKRTLLAILGPKRMAYDRNINLINSLIKTLERF